MQGFSSFSYCPASRDRGCRRSWERTQLGQPISADQRDVSHHMAACWTCWTVKCGQLVWGCQPPVQGQAGHASANDEQFHCASSVYSSIIVTLFLSFVCLWNFFILTHGFYLIFFVSLLQYFTLAQSLLHLLSGEKETLKDLCKCQNI